MRSDTITLRRARATCEYCGQLFTARACRIAVGKDKFCSTDCYHLSTRGKHRYKPIQGTLSERLWPRVDVRSPSECWEWQGAILQNVGYGQLWDNRIKRNIGTHRAAWEVTNGPIPDGLHVLHRCDNRPCCNPSHLFLGTHKDNMRDKMAKGRGSHKGPRGERSGRSKLTAAQVLAIRALEGRSIRSISREYGVSHHSITCILQRKTWTHI